ncbi:MAG: UDP-2,3-diacylglucosamine diphosphatase [Gammaproteobacteria bacterium]|nr:UDP-2,3-diacylglucosamine diphosphatase [Gammaproteobacteria bacterium]MDH3859635.1 UDP-2,3-diacylglucosamine diphosphatase [Gammaproteobacteria bacterium]
MNHEYLFISDCHLDARRPEVNAALTGFLDIRAASARCLYILGDLFEVWLGDDDPAPEHLDVIESLRQLASRVDVFFMAGNRDFLLGQAFAQNVNLRLLDEPHILQLGQDSVVLIHGDTLCTDDRDYQQFRSMVRTEKWQSDFLGKPLEERQQIAAQLRVDSVDAMAQKSYQIMDVNQAAVQDCFVRNGVNTIIHGHTHRPAIHHYDFELSRIVLGDWGREPSYLSWTPEQGFDLHDPRL